MPLDSLACFKAFPNSFSASVGDLISHVQFGKHNIRRTVWLERDHVPDFREQLDYAMPLVLPIILVGGGLYQYSKGCAKLLSKLGGGERWEKPLYWTGVSTMAGGAALSISSVLSVIFRDQAPDSSSGLQGNRNVTMARNAAEEIDVDHSSAILLVVGAAHNEGIAWFLQNSGFTTIYSR